MDVLDGRRRRPSSPAAGQQRRRVHHHPAEPGARDERQDRRAHWRYKKQFPKICSSCIRPIAAWACGRTSCSWPRSCAPPWQSTRRLVSSSGISTVKTIRRATSDADAADRQRQSHRRGARRRAGIRGYIAAYDADTGKNCRVRTRCPVPASPAPKRGRATTGKAAAARMDHGQLRSRAESDLLGHRQCGAVAGDAHPGDNLYTTSVVAIDPETGKFKNHSSTTATTPGDGRDRSAVADRHGKERKKIKTLVHPGRNGDWVLERKADSIDFVDGWKYVYTKRIDQHRQDFTTRDARSGIHSGRGQEGRVRAIAVGAERIGCRPLTTRNKAALRARPTKPRRSRSRARRSS